MHFDLIMTRSLIPAEKITVNIYQFWPKIVRFQAKLCTQYLSVWVDKLEQGVDDALRDDVVSALGAVSRDVAKGPDGLLAHMHVRGIQQPD